VHQLPPPKKLPPPSLKRQIAGIEAEAERQGRKKLISTLLAQKVR
jgi:hypothetical protein